MEASVGPAEGGEASHSELCRGFVQYCLARPATSERGAADIYIYIYIENAHATPPHLDVILRLGSSGDMLGFCSL